VRLRTVDAEAVREGPPVCGADELEALGKDPEPALHLLRALVALAVPASGRGVAVRSELRRQQRENGRRGIQETGSSPDGEAGEAEGVASAAERGDDGGLEHGRRAVGDGADRVGVGEGRRGGHGGRGGEADHGDGREEEAAAVGHVAGAVRNILLGFVRGRVKRMRSMDGSGQRAPQHWKSPVLYRTWPSFPLIHKFC
jgi:hypothetical protein